VLEGLLEQQTGLNPVEIMTDTAGTSDIILASSGCWDTSFPRLADAGEAVFWRVDKSANYGALDELARGCADLSKAEDQWDEMMRTAGSLKLGTIHASELIRSLLKSSPIRAGTGDQRKWGASTRRCTFLIILMMRIIVGGS
jgi:TnpA family transposase